MPISTSRLRTRALAGLLAVLTLPAPAADSLPGWLEGCWRRDGASAVTVERWLAPSGNMLLGVSETRREGHTVAWEFLRIVAAEDGVRYVAWPSGQAPTEFRRVPGPDGEWVFENPAHDFPQRIVYPEPVDGRLEARIEGELGGERRVVRFPLRAVSCEGAWRAAPGGPGEVAGPGQSG